MIYSMCAFKGILLAEISLSRGWSCKTSNYGGGSLVVLLFGVRTLELFSMLKPSMFQMAVLHYLLLAITVSQAASRVFPGKYCTLTIRCTIGSQLPSISHLFGQFWTFLVLGGSLLSELHRIF